MYLYYCNIFGLMVVVIVVACATSPKVSVCLPAFRNARADALNRSKLLIQKNVPCTCTRIMRNYCVMPQQQQQKVRRARQAKRSRRLSVGMHVCDFKALCVCLMRDNDYSCARQSRTAYLKCTRTHRHIALHRANERRGATPSVCACVE